MTERRSPLRIRRAAGPPRVGLFGILGAGNLGNDASMEVVLRYLRQRHPDAVVDAMTTAARQLTAQYGLDATQLGWRHAREQGSPFPVAVALKLLGKAVQATQTAAWVRRHDVVIVPGMGVLEASVPLRPWEFPYALFTLCAFGKLFRTKIALVSVGAELINKRPTRWLLNAAARQAFYRSYRDQGSLAAMRARGLDTTRDPVYPDLALGLPAPQGDPGDPRIVGIGVMAYYGDNDDDRRDAAQIHAAYVEKLKQFVRWLLDNGRMVRLFIGDDCDRAVVDALLDDARAYRPDLDPAVIVAEPISSFRGLMRAMAPVGTVVATRYHNVMCALMLAKPVVSVGYAEKNAELMSGMGLAEYCLSVRSLELDELIGRFTELEGKAGRLRPGVVDGCRASARLLGRQFVELSAALFPPAVQPAPSRSARPRGQDEVSTSSQS